MKANDVKLADEVAAKLSKLPPEIARMLTILMPAANDVIHLVLKMHLLAEEVMYRYLKSRAHYPKAIDDVRLSFPQLIALTRAFHRQHQRYDWWGWTALQKLNSLRNLLAHNLEPDSLQDRIAEFSLLVADGINAYEDQSYETAFRKGVNPFLLALIVLHTHLCIGLNFDPVKELAKSGPMKEPK